MTPVFSGGTTLRDRERLEGENWTRGMQHFCIEKMLSVAYKYLTQ